MEKKGEVIRIENLSKVYSGGGQGVCALSDISLRIKRNDYVAIMGPSGSGKSTLMHIIGCLDTPTMGRYLLNGIDVGSMSDGALSEVRGQEIGYVFQSFNLLPGYTALENVALPMIYLGVGKGERIKRASQALRRVNLSERLLHKPAELSGGQCQRVAIARALVNNPSIILADEPTGNLDSKTSVEIMNIFEEIYNEGNTIVLVTHEETIANYARRIIRLCDGKIVSDVVNLC